MTAYEQGFIKACESRGVDPEQLIKLAARGDQLAKLLASPGPEAAKQNIAERIYNTPTRNLASAAVRSRAQYQPGSEGLVGGPGSIIEAIQMLKGTNRINAKQNSMIDSGAKTLGNISKGYEAGR